MIKDDKLYRFIRIFFIITVKPPLYGHPPNTDTSLLRTVCLVHREDSPLTFSVNSTRLMQSINFIRMSKDMGKRLTKLYYTKIKNSYNLGFIAIGVAMAT